MRRLLAIFSLVVVASIAWAQDKTPPSAGAGEEPQAKIESTPQVSDEKPMSFWMSQKLVFSKSLLESLTMGDFDALAVDAKQMRFLGKIEGFVRRKNADYRTQVKNFDVALEQVISAAENDDIQSATQAFNQMTTSCVACHALLRQGID